MTCDMRLRRHPARHPDASGGGLFGKMKLGNGLEYFTLVLSQACHGAVLRLRRWDRLMAYNPLVVCVCAAIVTVISGLISGKVVLGLLFGLPTIVGLLSFCEGLVESAEGRRKYLPSDAEIFLQMRRFVPVPGIIVGIMLANAVQDFVT